METAMGIFKAYDIRGVVPDELDTDLAYRIGRAVPEALSARTVFVSRDMRISGPEIAEALVKGMLDAGADVTNAGETSTPMNYFGIGKTGTDAGVMVTASHNPPEYNGFKVSRDEAKPVSYETGLDRIEELATGAQRPKAEKRGSEKKVDIFPPYLEHLRRFTEGIEKGLRFVVDCGNGITGKFVRDIFGLFDADFSGLYLEPDGTFPNHEANPLKAKNLKDLQAKVKETGAQMGVAYDGDGDRIAFVDEKAEIIPSDVLGALMARYVLKENPGATIIYDLRSSRIVKEEIEADGGRPLESRVGHSFIKARMREHNSPFAAELSGHYYFKDNYYTDCGDMALLLLLRILSKEGKPLSELMAPLKRYVASGEINYEVEDKEGAQSALEGAFKDAAEMHRLDGVTVRYDDWWFNVRPSNTEPLLRLNLEAVDEARVKKGVQRVEEILKGFQA